MYHLIYPKSEIHTSEKRIYQNISLKNQKRVNFETHHLIYPKSEIHTSEKRIYQNISLKNQKTDKFRNLPSDLSKIQNPYIEKNISECFLKKSKKKVSFE